jgi:hypothetical protein
MADLLAASLQPRQLSSELSSHGGQHPSLDPDREIHPIPVAPTESHDQRKGWLAWRSAVDL